MKKYCSISLNNPGQGLLKDMSIQLDTYRELWKMQFESKITPNVIAKDEVLKQSQNQTQSRFINFRKRLGSLSRATKPRLLHSVRNDNPAYAYPHADRRGTSPAMTKLHFFSNLVAGYMRSETFFSLLESKSTCLNLVCQ